MALGHNLGKYDAVKKARNIVVNSLSRQLGRLSSYQIDKCMKRRSSEIDALANFIVDSVVREDDIMSRYSFWSDLRQRADTLGKRIKMDVDLDMMVVISLDPKAVVDDIRIGVNCDLT